MESTSVAKKDRYVAIGCECNQGEACKEAQDIARKIMKAINWDSCEVISGIYDCKTDIFADQMYNLLLQTKGFVDGDHADRMIKWFFEEGYAEETDENELETGFYQVLHVGREEDFSTIDDCGNRIEILLVPVDRKTDFLRSEAWKELKDKTGEILFYV